MDENKNAQAVADALEGNAQSQLHPILQALLQNQKLIISGVVAIVAAAAIYAGVNTYNASALNTAQSRLGTILIETSGTEKITQLQGLLNTAPSSAKPAILLELAQSSMVNGEYEQAAGYWDSLAAEADGNIKLVAHMGKAKALTMTGKASEAVTILKELAGKAPAELIVPVNRQLAVTGEQAGDTAVALAAYKILSENNVADKPFIDFKIAQLAQ